jgi:hypothetical protein
MVVILLERLCFNKIQLLLDYDKWFELSTVLISIESWSATENF